MSFFMSRKKRDERDAKTVYSESTWSEVFRRLLKNKVAMAGLIVFVIACLACVCAPLLTKYDYFSINVDRTKEGPSLAHIFGTDYLGRDLFTRLLYGGRVTLRIALGSTLIAAVAGCFLGLIIGFFGGRIDFYVSHFLDMLASIPVFLLIIVSEAALGWGEGNFMYAMAIAAIPQFARLVRASVMNIKGSEYIEASRALGVRNSGIIFRRIFHNIAPPLIIRFTSGVADALLLCTVMGYLGIGINPPTPEWGLIAYIGRAYIRSYPLMMIFPCVVITISVLSLCLFGDGLRDALDPRE